MKHAIRTIKAFIGKRQEHKRGFTLFVALIVSSLLLAVGLSLGNIILKQLTFSGSGSESQLAFYAADSGAECALYWDRKEANGDSVFYGAFATSTADAEILCGTGKPSGLSQVGAFSKVSDLTSATTTFYVNFSDTDIGGEHTACAMVTVSKWIETDLGYPVERTIMISRGYNAPLVGNVGLAAAQNPSAATCDTTGARVVERAVRLDY